MDQDRRRLLRRLGIAMLALAAGGCRGGHAFGTGAEDVTPGKPATPPPASDWTRLRESWTGLADLPKAIEEHEDDIELLTETTGRHRAILDALVAAGQLREPVAVDMQVAFAAAAHHVSWSVASPMCYRPMPGPQVDREAHQSLVDQAEVLSRMAGTAEIDEATLEVARKAITRDLTYLVMAVDEPNPFGMDKGRTYEDFVNLGNEASEDTKEAAQILTEVLLGQRN